MPPTEKPKVKCIDSSKYFLITGTPTDNAKKRHLIKFKASRDQKFECRFEIAEGDYELQNEEDSYVLGLENHFLIMGTGIGPQPRSLVVYDLKDRKNVYRTGYYEPFKIEDNKIDFWIVVAEATRENCPNLTEIDATRSEPAHEQIIGHVILDLNTLKKKEIETGKRECVQSSYAKELRNEFDNKMVERLSNIIKLGEVFNYQMIRPALPCSGETKKPILVSEILSPKTEIVFENSQIQISDERKDFSARVSYSLERIKKVKIPNEYDLITLKIKAIVDLGTDTDDDYVIKRYFASKNEIVKLPSANLSTTKADLKLIDDLIETELKKMYTTEILRIDESYYEGLSSPKCVIEFENSPSQFKKYSLSELQIEKNRMIATAVNGKEFWIRDVDPAVYVKSLDNVFYAYYPVDNLGFSFNKNDYECFGRPGQRESSSDQRRLRVQQIGMKGLLKVSEVNGVGTVYQINDDPNVPKFRDLIGEAISIYNTGYSYREKYESEHPDEIKNNSKNVKPARKNYESIPLDEFIKLKPVLYIVDPFSRVFECQAMNFVPDISPFVD